MSSIDLVRMGIKTLEKEAENLPYRTGVIIGTSSIIVMLSLDLACKRP